MIKDKIFSSKIKEHHIREKLALINLKQGKIIKTFRELWITVNSYPNSSFALGVLGQIYGSQKKYDKAKDLLKKAINLKSDDVELHYQLGILYLDTRELFLGIQELDLAFKLAPNHVKVQYFLALACWQNGAHEKAKMLFDKLNLKDLYKLPDNITQIGIKTQNIPSIKLTSIIK